MIDFDAFVSWAQDRFDTVVVKGEEVRVNSIFFDDNKQHLWCNPYGGKKSRENGCYHCFKTDKKGTLIGLVMLVDNCSWLEAKEMLSVDGMRLGNIEQELDEFFKDKDILDDNQLTLPKFTFLIKSMPEDSLHRMQAEYYLSKRQLSIENMYFCTDGDYKNRIIIPYYKDDKLIYYNSRHIANGKPRYLGPPKSVGVGKSEVLFAPYWPKSGKVFLTEGEFDALSLYSCGFNSVACGGKELSDNQLLMLKDYSVCLALDQDVYGLKAVMNMGEKLLSIGAKTSYIRPAIGYKDWNDMLVKIGKEEITKYLQGEKQFDQWAIDSLKFRYQI